MRLKNRILDVIKHCNLAGLATINEDGKPWVRYVMITGFKDMQIRFATFTNSRKVKQIQKNPEVHLTCGAVELDPRKCQNYLQIQGVARVSTDIAEKQAIWNDELAQFFQGVDDPNFSVVIVKPYRIEVWGMKGFEPEVWEAD